VPPDAVENRSPLEKRFVHALPLPNRLELVPEDVDSDVRVVDVDQAGLEGVVAAAAAAAAAACATSGYEVEFFVAQFNRIGKFGKFTHVTLLCTLLGVDGAVLTAATYPLVGIRQSRCNVA
jgi:hypothetical protein